eukprot:gnl/MRDRNA2_/MRDRNA2_78673_c0_seq2.p1 gnl/MRDRNA2_/MRDRNA2_78673_c0~~gnl/MRDRNA2_/MRDRNA2_78673_c0_seq2.p1  ORF type:complete len:136 (-),score=20.45 gnl/MRDRNA2_/MRDRNA2_78673_c0_seq2:109-516(-)
MRERFTSDFYKQHFKVSDLSLTARTKHDSSKGITKDSTTSGSAPDRRRRAAVEHLTMRSRKSRKEEQNGIATPTTPLLIGNDEIATQMTPLLIGDEEQRLDRRRRAAGDSVKKSSSRTMTPLLIRESEPRRRRGV